MSELFRNILNASFQGGVLILAVLVLRLVLRKAPKRLTCLLWILVGLRLLTPFSIESELSLQPENQVVSREHWQELRDYGQILPENIHAEQPETVPPAEEVIPVKPADTELEETPVVNDVPVTYTINWAKIAPYLWLIAAAAMGIYCLISYLRLKRRVREAVRDTDGIWESDRIDTAFILGYLLPRIYLPMGMEPADRRMILEHERSHMKNGDHWVKLIGFIALAIHWFNPLVWVAYICLCRDIEMACDERVIRDMSLSERKSYSAALLSCSSNRAHFAACPVAFGEKPVRKRILAVLNYRRPGFWITVAAVIAVVLVAVCFLTNPVVKVDPLTLEDWGVTMTAEESSATGVTVVFDLPEKTEGNFIFNFGPYELQAESDGEWVDVPMVSQEDPVLAWNGHVSMLFPNDLVQRLALDWTTVYGELPPGRYRVRGTLMLTQDGYGYKKDFYATFRIWDSEEQKLSAESWEEECRAVLEDIQRSGSCHIRVERTFGGELSLDDWNRSEYWRSGDNWLHILENQDRGVLDGVQYDGIYSDLYLDGGYYSGFSSNQQMVWQQEEKTDIPVLWLADFDMDARDAEVISRTDTEEGYILRLMVYGDNDTGTLAYDSYYVDFCFDAVGNFRYAVQYIHGTGELMGAAVEQSIVSTMYAEACSEEEFDAAVESYAADMRTPLSYTDSATSRRVTEELNPTVTFSGATKDTETVYGIYHFDPAVPEEERSDCVFYMDAILSRLELQSRQELVILADYEGAWTDGSVLYLGAGDYSRPENGAKLIITALGGYVNYGAAYGYAEYIGVQEGWRGARSYRVSLTDSDARDLNWLCFREEFVSAKEIKANIDVACVFAMDYIADKGEAAMVQLLRQSGQVSGVEVFNDALAEWYAGHGLDYDPTEILYAIGGEYHDYLAKCRYATFYMPRDWENRHFSALAKDGDFLHESYPDVKLYYETSAGQMAYIQQMFGVDEDTSEISVEFLLSGTGGTWAARNQILLNYHGYIPRSYLNMMLFRHTEIRLHGGSYYEWLYHGLAEYTAQVLPSLYEDEVLIYFKEHENSSYSVLGGEWYSIWQEVTEGETDPDVLWRAKWDLLAFYYDREFHNGSYGQISFSAYLAEQIGLQTLWDYFLVTENESPEIDFAKYRTEWEAYLEETYGQYPKFSDYKE